MAPALQNIATFRFYGDLDVFLPLNHRGRERPYLFNAHPSVKDAIEAQGIPHPEVALILANGEPVSFQYLVLPGDRFSVYPAFRTLPPASGGLARDPDKFRAVLDVNLGKLARWLRLLGFDALYQNDFDDAEVATISATEGRVALTRDRRLLHHKQIVHGYWVRADDPLEQIVEIVTRYDLRNRIRPFHRCTACNGLIGPVDKEEVWDLLEPKTKRYYDTFFRCVNCRKIYWRGSHHAGILKKMRLSGILNEERRK